MDRLPNQNRKVKIKINGEETRSEPKIKVYDWQDARRELSATEEIERPKMKPRSNERLWNSYRRPRMFKPARRKAVTRGVPKLNPMSIIAGVSAIVLGVLLGILLLKMMIPEPESVETTASVQETPQHNQNEQPQATDRQQMVLPSVSIYVLQQGVYSNLDNVNQLVQQSSGPMAYVKSDELYLAFVAVADSLDSAKSMLDSASTEELFAKQVTMNEKVLQNLTEDEKLFLESAFPFYQRIVNEGSKRFILKEAHQPNLTDLEATYNELRSLDQFSAEQLKQLHGSLIKAYESMLVFFQSNQNEDWQNTQKNLVQFVSSYYSL